MAVSMDLIKELRHLTSAGISDCKKALEDADGDLKKAVELIRKRGLEIAAKKQSRTASQGRIEAYVHLHNKIGVLVEVNCETDFVAKNDDFKRFTKDLAMQIAACAPAYVKKEDVPEDIIQAEEDKENFYKTNCLLQQPFIKDPSIAIKDYLTDLIAKIGENIVVRRFTRYQIG